MIFCSFYSFQKNYVKSDFASDMTAYTFVYTTLMLLINLDILVLGKLSFYKESFVVITNLFLILVTYIFFYFRYLKNEAYLDKYKHYQICPNRIKIGFSWLSCMLIIGPLIMIFINAVAKINP